MLGMGALYAFAVAAITRLMQLGLGPLGALVASLVFIFLNFPSSGGSVAPQLMPGFWRFLNHVWIGAAGLDANRSVLYFHCAGVGTDVLTILAWTAACAALLAIAICVRTTQKDHRDRRSQGPNRITGEVDRQLPPAPGTGTVRSASSHQAASPSPRRSSDDSCAF